MFKQYLIKFIQKLLFQYKSVWIIKTFPLSGAVLHDN